MEDIILLGFGGHAKSVIDCLERRGNTGLPGFWIKKNAEIYVTEDMKS